VQVFYFANSSNDRVDTPGFGPVVANEGDQRTCWLWDFAARDGWLAIDHGEGKQIGRVLLSEIEWPVTREFAIEIKQADVWKELAHGKAIGQGKNLVFEPDRAREIHSCVLRAQRPVNINEFQVFTAEKV
jgi:hypothetical protein